MAISIEIAPAAGSSKSSGSTTMMKGVTDLNSGCRCAGKVMARGFARGSDGVIVTGSEVEGPRYPLAASTCE